MKNKKIAMGLAIISLFALNSSCMAFADNVNEQSTTTYKSVRSFELPALLGYVTADELNIRSGPGTNYTAIDSLSRGQSLFVHTDKYENGFYYVDYYENNTHTHGWAYAKYMTLHPD